MTTQPHDDPSHGRPEPTAAPPATCDGSGRPLNPVEAQRWTVCLDCTRARHRAAASGRCTCGERKAPGDLCRVGSRSWVPCRRCLGTIRQVS